MPRAHQIAPAVAPISQKMASSPNAVHRPKFRASSPSTIWPRIAPVRPTATLAPIPVARRCVGNSSLNVGYADTHGGALQALRFWHRNRQRREPSSLGPRSRLSAGDWEEAAIDVLSQHGLSAIAVEPLAQRIGVTKGSFYAHFDTRDDLIAAVLARWEAVDKPAARRAPARAAAGHENSSS